MTACLLCKYELCALKKQDLSMPNTTGHFLLD